MFDSIASLPLLPASWYRCFVATLRWSGRILQAALDWLYRQRSAKPYSEQFLPDEDFISSFGPTADFHVVDRLATARGDTLRGIGVLCGALSGVVLLLALWPHALDMPGGMRPSQLKYLELTLMVVIILALFVTRFSGLKRRWIQTRIFAERLRYAELSRALDTASVGDAPDTAPLQQQLQKLLSNESGSQFQYHRERVVHYEQIELAVRGLTYLCFGLSIIGVVLALLHIPNDTFSRGSAPIAPAAASGPASGSPSSSSPTERSDGLHRDKILLLVVFLPAVAAILHGVVSFLRLPQLIGQHELTAHELKALSERLERLQASEGSAAELRAIGRALLALLTRGDTAWTSIARLQDVHPV
jgi:hypothetical protein